MKSVVITATALAFAVTCLLSPAPAEAKGCLKGALVGGVAGHYAGHHAIIGALGGCAVGHHLANEKAAQPKPTAAQDPILPASPQNSQ
jgi:hypothetical protein